MLPIYYNNYFIYKETNLNAMSKDELCPSHMLHKMSNNIYYECNFVSNSPLDL